MPEAPAAAVILAAGASTRLGQPKQLIAIEEETLLRRTARLAIGAGCAPTVVVLGSQAERMRSQLEDLPVRIVENAAWREGMGSSLRCGMTALADVQPPPAAVLLLVCDQPRLSASHLDELLTRHAGGRGKIVASSYGGRPGVPAVFSTEFFPELSTIAGDRGARDLIRRHLTEVHEIPWPEGELDLDTPADLQFLNPQ